MSDEELAQIEARANAATKGSWSNNVEKCGSQQWYGEDGLYFQPTGPASLTVTQCENDSAFIAHAREDIPALIAEVRRLQFELEKAQYEHACELGMVKEPDPRLEK